MDITQFHFLRPAWLLALLPWLWLLVTYWRRHSQGGVWERVIDPQLRPFVLMGGTSLRRSRLALWLAAVASALMILAQAGPVWQKRPQPLFKQQSALVIALDLSHSMDSTDLAPSRLARARFKMNDILDRRRDGQTALLVWAATPFTVTPLTDDVATIRALAPSLSTDMMPAQGSRTDLAVEKAVALMKNAGQLHGDILLLTDGAGGAAEPAIEQARRQGYRVSILAVGTASGAPIPLPSGGFLKDSNGGIVIPKLDSKPLRALAQLGGGRFSTLSADDRDVDYLLAPINQPRLDPQARKTQLNTDTWVEQGPWLLLLALPLAALLFRRGEILLLLVFLLPLPQPAQATEWQDLWLNPNQQAAKLLQQKQAAAAAKKFTDRQWKAAADYRAGNYQQVIKDLEGVGDAESWYNRGNALAKSGQLPQALSAYETALKKDPQLADAQYNKELIEKALQKQQRKNSSSDSSAKQQKSGQQKKSQKDGRKGAEDSSAQGAQPSQDEQASEQQQRQAQDKKESNGKNSTDKKDGKKNPTATEQQTPAEQQAGKSDEKDVQGAPPSDEQPLTDEQRATRQWLRRIPDDPGGLLRRKFRYQYQQQQQAPREPQPW